MECGMFNGRCAMRDVELKMLGGVFGEETGTIVRSCIFIEIM